MKKLFILRGVMGSGKSTFIMDNNLNDYTLNPDKMRLMFNSPEMTINYNEMIPQFNNEKIWNLLYEILEERMKKGELTLIDAMHIYNEDFKTYKKLAEKYRYRLYVIDFTNIELSELLDRNTKRIRLKWVKEETIKRAFNTIKKESVPKSFKIIKPDEFNNIISSSRKNVDKYNKIHIFGDIHGCYEPLKEYFTDIKDDELYIFTGDYFDRGLDNIKTFEFIKENMNKDNFIFLIGNHEDRLYKFACDDTYKMDYDLLQTLKEFEGTIKKSEIRGLIKGLSQIANIEYKGKYYLINHGGIPYYPDKSLDFYSSNSFIYGIDKYEIDIDKIYNKFMKEQKTKIYQAHGHRNFYKIKYNEYDYSYNLDGDIENGGYLRVLILNNDGTTSYKKIKNNKYDPKLKEKENVYTFVRDSRLNKYITEKELEPSLSSFNFTKEAFHNNIWNNMTTKARGIFIDTNNYLVVARSYNKFFNLDERKDTKYDYLKDKLIYPANFYLKYNGFLGILSVHNDELLFATKSNIKGTYNDYFKNIFNKTFTNNQIKIIKNRLIKNNSSMVFEVIDSINDKHIIKYNEDKLILLDEIYNSINYSKVDYKELKEFADTNEIEIKKLAYEAKNSEDLDNIFNIISEADYKYNNKYIEGFVLEDNSGFMVKYKTEYYKLWKLMRTKMEYAIKNNNYKTKNNNDIETNFIKYLENKYKDKDINVDSINIIDERDNYLKE